MKKLFKLFAVTIAVFTAVVCSAVSSSAMEKALTEDSKQTEQRYNEDFYVIEGKTDFGNEGKGYVLVGKTVINKDTDVGSKRIYLKSGSCLIINSGASLSTNGTITLERGAKLYVTNGKFVCGTGSVLENYGRIIVREKGILDIQRVYKSNGGSSINLQGEMQLGKLSVSKIAAKIKKYDNKFNLNDYCISYSNKSAQTATFYYCIDDIVTDYYYQYSGSKLVRKGYSLNKVYNSNTRETLRVAANKYYSDNGIKEKFSDDKMYFSIDRRFDYSYSTKEMLYREAYFKYSPESDGMFLMIDAFKEDKITL